MRDDTCKLAVTVWVYVYGRNALEKESEKQATRCVYDVILMMIAMVTEKKREKKYKWKKDKLNGRGNRENRTIERWVVKEKEESVSYKYY